MMFPVWFLTKNAYLLFCFFVFLQVTLSKLCPKSGNGFHMRQHYCLLVVFLLKLIL